MSHGICPRLVGGFSSGRAPLSFIVRPLDHVMNKKSSDWYVPPDIAFLFSFYFVLPIVAILSGTLLPLVAHLKSGDVVGIFYSALVLGAVGTVLLFCARLPLYRKRQFLTLGPRQLSGIHRRFYWLAYLFVAVSILLLVLIWLRLR